MAMVSGQPSWRNFTWNNLSFSGTVVTSWLRAALHINPHCCWLDRLFWLQTPHYYINPFSGKICIPVLYCNWHLGQTLSDVQRLLPFYIQWIYRAGYWKPCRLSIQRYSGSVPTLESDLCTWSCKPNSVKIMLQFQTNEMSLVKGRDQGRDRVFFVWQLCCLVCDSRSISSRSNVHLSACRQLPVQCQLSTVSGFCQITFTINWGQCPDPDS